MSVASSTSSRAACFCCCFCWGLALSRYALFKRPWGEGEPSCWDTAAGGQIIERAFIDEERKGGNRGDEKQCDYQMRWYQCGKRLFWSSLFASSPLRLLSFSPHKPSRKRRDKSGDTEWREKKSSQSKHTDTHTHTTQKSNNHVSMVKDLNHFEVFLRSIPIAFRSLMAAPVPACPFQTFVHLSICFSVLAVPFREHV